MGYMKCRRRPPAGSIPDLLDMFDRELRFYREIASEIGVRTPRLNDATVNDSEVVLDLEDVSGWNDTLDPVAVAHELRALHLRWTEAADDRWPWLNRRGAAADEIGAHYDRVWTDLRLRPDVTPAVRRLGDALGGRVAHLEHEESARLPRTLIHGDASMRNTRTSVDGEIVFLDWEDTRTAQGEVDLTWLLLSSVEPAAWGDVIDAYEPDHEALRDCFPANIAQAILAFSDHEPGSEAAQGWLDRLEIAASITPSGAT